MDKKIFTVDDVEGKIKENAEYENIKGEFIISTNTIVLGPSVNGIKFICSENAIDNFIFQIILTLNELSNIPSGAHQGAWVPLPGVTREKIIERYTQNKEYSLNLLKEDPNIVIIKKINDHGKKIIWISPDGKIGQGATPLV